MVGVIDSRARAGKKILRFLPSRSGRGGKQSVQRPQQNAMYKILVEMRSWRDSSRNNLI
jgi:hypothetical protein